MRLFASALKLTAYGAAALVMACGNDTLRAQTPTTTTGPYNTGTTATPGLSAGRAAGALGESSGKPVGAVAPPPALGATSASTSTGTANEPRTGATP